MRGCLGRLPHRVPGELRRTDEDMVRAKVVMRAGVCGGAAQTWALEAGREDKRRTEKAKGGEPGRQPGRGLMAQL